MPKDKITLFAQKIEGKEFEYEDEDGALIFIDNAPPGRYVIEIKRDRPPKSQKQLGMIFGHMIEETIRQADEKAIGVEELLVYLLAGNIPKGVAITKDFLHALMYVICPTVDEEGNKITLSKMNTLQANELFERFRTILGPLGICIDDPKKE